MRTQLLLAAAFSAASMAVNGLPGIASAETVNLVYSGTISEGYDRSGLFGVPYGGSLANDSFTVSLLIDTDQGNIQQSANAYTIEGGLLDPDGGASPSISTTFAVDGISAPSFGGNYDGFFHAENDGYASLLVALTSGGTNLAMGSFVSELLPLNGAIPKNLTTPFNYTLQPNDMSSVAANYIIFNTIESGFSFDGDVNTVSLSVVSSGPVSAAPEPSAWMLMIAGIAMIGGILRFSRKRGVGSLSVA